MYEIDGASTTDGGIDIHWADLSDKIDGTYENKGYRCFLAALAALYLHI